MIVPGKRLLKKQESFPVFFINCALLKVKGSDIYTGVVRFIRSLYTPNVKRT